ncbi:hypothetical protein B0H67DRAFT_572965 [Lasiosphaeris hirsuta]|uniref:Uncharacterized protein n=1 Tax=Lasiosphaeris hirsuta TaxID=260670 RepID=A0AA40ANZ6_9PEZI|nr:hypothetical protein B0H67DRAFT_572965 [Lasiosphaeris hirsuta]
MCFERSTFLDTPFYYLQKVYFERPGVCWHEHPEVTMELFAMLVSFTGVAEVPQQVQVVQRVQVLYHNGHAGIELPEFDWWLAAIPSEITVLPLPDDPLIWCDLLHLSARCSACEIGFRDGPVAFRVTRRSWEHTPGSQYPNCPYLAINLAVSGNYGDEYPFFPAPPNNEAADAPRGPRRGPPRRIADAPVDEAADAPFDVIADDLVPLFRRRLFGMCYLVLALLLTLRYIYVCHCE